VATRKLPPRVATVRIVGSRTVEVAFQDATVRTIDLAPLLWGPVFAEIASDNSAFSAVFVDEQLGTLAWPNGADLDPDVLYGAEQPVPAPTGV
jgi:Protein of unknown function (DUF2442)